MNEGGTAVFALRLDGFVFFQDNLLPHVFIFPSLKQVKKLERNGSIQLLYGWIELECPSKEEQTLGFLLLTDRHSRYFTS